MKIKVRFSAGLEATKFVSAIPVEGAIFEGELVEKVTLWNPPVGGCLAMVVLTSNGTPKKGSNG
ncbi:hypothetical protein [Roseovarius mucosus]|uniref:hypothetical protein n=1 Tax=Roseovarius mucosus TaxID=215743 RepID=UPI003F716650